MKVIFHKRFHEVYTNDPASAPGRMEAIVKQFKGKFELIEPEPASERDLERVHGRSHIESVKQEEPVHEIGLLAARGNGLVSLKEGTITRSSGKMSAVFFKD